MTAKLHGMILISLFALSSCKTINEGDDIYVLNKDRKGSVFGFVRMFDEFGAPIPDSRGVEVSLAGLQPEVKAVSDSNGRYQLDSIRGGVYLAQYKKPGLGFFERELVFTAPGGNEPMMINDLSSWVFWGPGPFTNLYQISTTRPLLPQVQYNTGSIDTTNRFDSLLVFTGEIQPAGTQRKPRTVLILFDTLPGVRPDRFLTGVQAYFIRSANYRAVLLASMADVLKKGRTYYARAYGSPAHAGEVFDRRTGKYLMSTLGPEPSPEFTFTPRW